MELGTSQDRGWVVWVWTVLSSLVGIAGSVLRKVPWIWQLESAWEAQMNGLRYQAGAKPLRAGCTCKKQGWEGEEEKVRVLSKDLCCCLEGQSAACRAAS